MRRSLRIFRNFSKKKSCYMLSKFSAFWLKVQKSIRRSWKESSSAEVYHIFREFISFFSFRKKKTPKPDPGPSLYFRILDVSLEKLLEVFVNKHFEDFFGKCLQESVEEFLGGITCRIPGYMFWRLLWEMPWIVPGAISEVIPEDISTHSGTHARISVHVLKDRDEGDGTVFVFWLAF